MRVIEVLGVASAVTMLAAFLTWHRVLARRALMALIASCLLGAYASAGIQGWATLLLAVGALMGLMAVIAAELAVPAVSTLMAFAVGSTPSGRDQASSAVRRFPSRSQERA